VCGVWCGVWSVWCAVCGMWCVVCDTYVSMTPGATKSVKLGLLLP
jgi:hypothetical protein